MAIISAQFASTNVSQIDRISKNPQYLLFRKPLAACRQGPSARWRWFLFPIVLVRPTL